MYIFYFYFNKNSSVYVKYKQTSGAANTNPSKKYLSSFIIPTQLIASKMVKLTFHTEQHFFQQ